MTNSGRNPGGIRAERVPESAFSQPASQQSSHIPSSSRIEALGATGENLTARIRNLDTLDAAAHTITVLRPDWTPSEVRQVLARDRRPWAAVVAAALAAALNPDVRRPTKIETYAVGDLVPTPMPASFEQQRRELKCPHGAPSGMCYLCRSGVE
jgi:hypothetical protein